MTITRRLLLGLALAFPMLAITGCGNTNVVPISGTVTYKGKAVANAFIHFVPDGGGRPSQGETDANGKFTLTYDPETKGALRGKHKVWVQFNPIEAQVKASAPGTTVSAPAETKEAFEKYSGDKSTKSVEITKAESDLKIDLD